MKIEVTILAALLNVVACYVVRDYNTIHFHEFSSNDEFYQKHFTLSGGRSNNNLFVGVAQPECHEKLESAAFRGAQRHAGGHVIDVVTVPAKDFPLPLTGCAEVFFYGYNSSITNPTDRTDQLDHLELTRWGGQQMGRKVKFVNDFDFPVEMYWSDEGKDPVRQGILNPGKETTITTFLGHIFSIRRVVDRRRVLLTDPLVDFMVVQENEYHLSPHNRLESCEIVPGTENLIQQDLSCDNMELRFEEFCHQVWYGKRLGLNFVQPKMVRPVTRDGFRLIPMPASTYAWLKSWYQQQQKAIEVEESAVGPCMNQYVAPSAVTHLSSDLKDRLSQELKPILQSWYAEMNPEQLELTSIYGIRKYTNGSVLRMHVDTVNTHVVSAIINVDQDVEKDWPLLILDHNDAEHNLVMKPGDMVLYESAKLLHGRPEPFVGKHYDNIFIHYRPESGWDYNWV